MIRKPSDIHLDFIVNKENMEPKEQYWEIRGNTSRWGQRGGLLGNRSNAMMVQIADEVFPSRPQSATTIFLLFLPLLDQSCLQH